MEKKFAVGAVDVLRAIFFGILIAFVLVLIFAIFVKTLGPSEKVISGVNAGIKAFAACAGAVAGIKNKRAGFMKGLISGTLFICVAFLIFALLGGGFENAEFSVFDVLLGAVAGAIGGIIKVNVK